MHATWSWSMPPYPHNKTLSAFPFFFPSLPAIICTPLWASRKFWIATPWHLGAVGSSGLSVASSASNVFHSRLLDFLERISLTQGFSFLIFPNFKGQALSTPLLISQLSPWWRSLGKTTKTDYLLSASNPSSLALSPSFIWKVLVYSGSVEGTEKEMICCNTQIFSFSHIS